MSPSYPQVVNIRLAGEHVAWHLISKKVMILRHNRYSKSNDIPLLAAHHMNKNRCRIFTKKWSQI